MLTPGTPITYTLDNLGTLEHPTSTRTTPHVVNAGDRGKYLGTLPVFGEPDRWHMTTVQHEGRTLYVPVHEDMFTAEQPAERQAEDDPYDMPQEPGWDLTREEAERFAAEVGAELRGDIPPVTP